MVDPIVGAAVYFDPKAVGPVTVEGLDEALRLLALSNVPVREFETVGSPTFDEELRPYPPNARRLREALASEPVKILRLCCHATKLEDLVAQWQALAEINGRYGCIFLGMPPEAGLSLKEVLVAVHRLARTIVRSYYGIAYLRSNLFGPGQYAKGMIDRSTKLPFPEDLPTRERIGRWHTEKLLSGHYPQDQFRSVYPVQLLSEAHRQAKLDTGVTVAESGLGTWTPAEDGLWLWELTAAELVEAKALFERSGLLLAA